MSILKKLVQHLNPNAIKEEPNTDQDMAWLNFPAYFLKKGADKPLTEESVREEYEGMLKDLEYKGPRKYHD